MTWTPAQKMLNTSTADFGRYATVLSMINSSHFKVYVNGIQYTAITSKRYSISNDIQTEKCENGMEYSDHVYSTPLDISFEFYVSKVDLTEFNRLKSLYTNRDIVSIKSIVYDCPQAQFVSFSVTDNLMDVYVIQIDVAEIYYGDVSALSSMDERFQIVSGYNKYNVSTTVGSSEFKSDATASEENLKQTQANLGQKILVSDYMATLLGRNNRVVNVPGDGYYITWGKSSSSESLSSTFPLTQKWRSKQTDSISQNASYVERNTSIFSSVNTLF